MSERLNSLAGALAGQKVLVTGATGLIGQRLVRILAQNDVSVQVLSRRPDAAGELWPQLDVEISEGDLAKASSITHLCQGVDTVFHLASYAPAAGETEPEDNLEHERVTVNGTRNLLDAARKSAVQGFIFSSSSHAAGGRSSRYARAKQEAEHMVMAASETGIRACVLRFAPVYGFARKGNIALMLGAIDRGRFPPIADFGDKRSLLHLDDAVQAMLLAAVNPQASGKTYVVTDLIDYSTRSIYEAINRALGKNIPSWYVPLWLLKVLALAGDLLEKVSGRSAPIDTEKLEKLTTSALFNGCDIQRELDYRPAHTLETALPQIIHELRSGVRP